jgi:plasmid stability protein
MPSITIRDVPEETRAELAARAAASGRSLQEYLRATLVDLAERPDLAQVLDRIRSRKRATEANLTADQILEYRDADRR